MLEMDELLQQKLDALERGQELEQVLAELPEEASELGALISLASTLQSMPHPQPHKQNSLASLQSVAAHNTTQPARQRRRLEWPLPRLALVTGVAGVALVLLIALVSMSALGIWLAGPRAAHVATLMDVTGVVGVGPDDSTEGWEPVKDGTQIREGQHIRTGAQGSVTLVFFEGSRASLGPNTDLSLTVMDGGWGDVLRVELSQQAGDTHHSVLPFQSKKSAYLVQTPSGAISVHGTIFNISVDEMGQARFTVDTGKVMVTNQDSEVTLEAGQATTAQPGQELQSPAYQFKLEGFITSMDGDMWTANDVTFQVTGETQLEGNPQEGSYVEVKGHVGQAGMLVADKVEVTTGGDMDSSFTGVVESMGEGEWRISGKTVEVGSFTEIDPGIEEGHAVKVTFIVVENLRWRALRIKSLETEPPVEPKPIETEDPGEVTAPTTGDDTLETDCTGTDSHPKGEALAVKHGVSYEEIMGWFCQRFGFGEIDLAYSLSEDYGVPVETIFIEMRRGRGLGWGQIKKEIKLITPVNVPGDGEETPVPPDEVEDTCMGKKAKQGEKLAARLGVGYDDIVGLFCDGKYALNDIEHAYKLKQRLGSDIPVEVILAKHAGGMNWGEIQKWLDPKPVKIKKPK